MQTRYFPAHERGHVTFDWLDTYHSFSFGHFYNPDLMGFGLLRVVNDDTIAPGAGFGKHPHQNMEIITIPLSGAVRHEDSSGGAGVIPAGEVQIMSAGTGVVHSEMNASSDEPLTLLQIWIEPEKPGLAPRYAQKSFAQKMTGEGWTTLVSADEREDSLLIHQNAYLSWGAFSEKEKVTYTFQGGPNQGIFFMVLEGNIQINEEKLGKRDAIGVSETENFTFTPLSRSQVLSIEIPLVLNTTFHA